MNIVEMNNRIRELEEKEVERDKDIEDLKTEIFKPKVKE